MSQMADMTPHNRATLCILFTGNTLYYMKCSSFKNELSKMLRTWLINDKVSNCWLMVLTCRALTADSSEGQRTETWAFHTAAAAASYMLSSLWGHVTTGLALVMHGVLNEFNMSSYSSISPAPPVHSYYHTVWAAGWYGVGPWVWKIYIFKQCCCYSPHMPWLHRLICEI